MEYVLINNVVEFSLSEDKKTIIATEQCDFFYKAELNKEEIDQFIADLKKLSKQIK